MPTTLLDVIPPLLLLSVLLLGTAVAAVTALILRSARSARVAALAAQWQMRFTPDDRFQLTPRVAANLPQPGAADVRLRNLVYGQDPAGALRYFFTVEYTLGVVRTKRRRVSVGTLLEDPAAAATSPGPEPFAGVTLAPADLTLPDQYQWLRQRHATDQPPEARQTSPAGAVTPSET